MSSHALTTRMPAVDAFGRRRASRFTRLMQAAVILALIPVAAFYLYPRVYDLVATPYRLDQAVVYADKYNPALHKIVGHEKVTLAAFDALDRMDRSLANVRATDAKVAGELKVLIGQITGDLQDTLDHAGANVGGLVSSLDGLDSRLRSLHTPVDGASNAVRGDRAQLGAILADARSTAAKVHSASVTAGAAADNVSGN